MNEAIAVRPARKTDASEIALLTNIAVHGGLSQRWAADEAAGDTYDPVEIGRLTALADEAPFTWRNATMAESDGEVVGMLMGYRQPDEAEPLPDELPPFLLPINQLEAEAAGRWAFPFHAVEPETLRLGEQTLRDADPTPALRRKLVDQLDDLARALRIRRP